MYVNISILTEKTQKIAFQSNFKSKLSFCNQINLHALHCVTLHELFCPVKNGSMPNKIFPFQFSQISKAFGHFDFMIEMIKCWLWLQVGTSLNPIIQRITPKIKANSTKLNFSKQIVYTACSHMFHFSLSFSFLLFSVCFIMEIVLVQVLAVSTWFRIIFRFEWTFTMTK